MADFSTEWSRFFHTLSRFIEGAERQYGVANQDFAEYVLERLELCIQTCSNLGDHMLSDSDQLEEEEVLLVIEHKETLFGLIECLRSLQQRWMEYRDILDASYSFQAEISYRPGTQRQGRGRPRFRIEKSQLEYLASLSFNWSEIAALLGVSRMTIYRYELYYNNILYIYTQID